MEPEVVVEFPLRGEGWMAVTTPAHRVPSHGTDLLGQRYAYDFVKVDERSGVHVQPGGHLRELLLGGRTRDAYAWGAPVHAAVGGEVVTASDGFPERQRVHPVAELFRMVRNGLTFTPDRLPAILGNHVIVRFGDRYAVSVHLAPGSIRVVEGQRVEAGDVLGRVGHTGNSTTPHLHFQVMDALDPMTAKGVPCAFRAYEVQRGDHWARVEVGVPGRRERIRSVG